MDIFDIIKTIWERQRQRQREIERKTHVYMYMREWLVRGGWFYLLFSFEISLLDSDPTSMVISVEDGLFYIREREREGDKERERKNHIMIIILNKMEIREKKDKESVTEILVQSYGDDNKIR